MRMKRRGIALTAAVVLASAGAPLTQALPAYGASTLGVTKSASVTTAQPGDEFRYTIVPRCSGLTRRARTRPWSTSCRRRWTSPPFRRATPIGPADLRRHLSAADRLQDPAARAQSGGVGRPAGLSNNVEIGSGCPTTAARPTGSVIPNTAPQSPRTTRRPPRTAPTWQSMCRGSSGRLPPRPGATEARSPARARRARSRSACGTRLAPARVGSLTVEDASADTFDRFHRHRHRSGELPARHRSRHGAGVHRAPVGVRPGATTPHHRRRPDRGLSLPSGIAAPAVTDCASSSAAPRYGGSDQSRRGFGPRSPLCCATPCAAPATPTARPVAMT